MTVHDFPYNDDHSNAWDIARGIYNIQDADHACKYLGYSPNRELFTISHERPLHLEPLSRSVSLQFDEEGVINGVSVYDIYVMMMALQSMFVNLEGAFEYDTTDTGTRTDTGTGTT